MDKKITQKIMEMAKEIKTTTLTKNNGIYYTPWDNDYVIATTHPAYAYCIAYNDTGSSQNVSDIMGDLASPEEIMIDAWHEYKDLNS